MVPHGQSRHSLHPVLVWNFPAVLGTSLRSLEVPYAATAISIRRIEQSRPSRTVRIAPRRHLELSYECLELHYRNSTRIGVIPWNFPSIQIVISNMLPNSFRRELPTGLTRKLMHSLTQDMGGRTWVPYTG